MKPHILNRFLITQLLAAVCITSSAYATDRTWTGVTSTNWLTATNWSGGVAPGAADRALFGALGSPNTRPIGPASPDVQVLQIRFNSGGASFSGANSVQFRRWIVGNNSGGANTAVEVETGNTNNQTIDVGASDAHVITVGNQLANAASVQTILHNGSGLLTVGSSATGGIWIPGSTAGRDDSIIAFDGTGNTQVGGIGSGDLAIVDNGTGTGTGRAILGLTKNGSGTLTLTSNNNTYTGATTVSNGALIINGNISTSVTTVTGGTLGGTGTTGALAVNSGGTFAPGDGGIESLNTGALTLAGSSLFEINTAGDAADLAISSGLLTFGGTLTVTQLGGALQSGDVFNLFDWNTVTGTFSDVTLPTLGGGLTWDQSNLYNNGTIAVVPEPAAVLLGSLGLLALLRRRRN